VPHNVNRSEYQVRVEHIAEGLIHQYGAGAVHIAIKRLNHSIDLREQAARDFWAQVVCAVLDQQRAGASIA